jgi:hypothetical protein
MARHVNRLPGGAWACLPTPVADYLAEVEVALPGPRRARHDLMTELADGLVDATHHYRRQGLPPLDAARRAIRDSGPSALVGAEFAALMHRWRARRTAQTLLATGPPIGLLWLVVLVPGRGPGALMTRLPLLAGVVCLAIVASAATLLMTGPAPRWLPPVRIDPLHAAATACAAAALCDLMVLAVAAQTVLHGSATSWTWAIAATASLTRLAYAPNAARRLRDQPHRAGP